MAYRNLNFAKAERFFLEGDWDSAETLYQKVIRDCDSVSRLNRRRQSFEKLEAFKRLYEIASAMHREDDAELWAGMLTE